VRLKLDQVGIKLSLKQWSRMPEEYRQELLSLSCETPAQAALFKANLAGWIASHTDLPVEYCDIEPAPPWADTGHVPERIKAWASDLKVAPPAQSQWARLTSVQRFALFKLTRPGHSNENFLPAMREFNLLND
jgi:hypothetical protein